MLVDVSLRQAERDGKCGVLDFSIITPAAESYCAGAAKQPLHAAKIREDAKILKYLQAYKSLDDIHFEPFVVESGGQLGERAQEIFKKICNLITQTTGQSGSSIAYFWKSRLLVTLAKITYSNALRWATAHNKSKDPDSAPIDLNYGLLRRRHSRNQTDDAQQRSRDVHQRKGRIKRRRLANGYYLIALRPRNIYNLGKL